MTILAMVIIKSLSQNPGPCSVCALSCSGYSWKGNTLVTV